MTQNLGREKGSRVSDARRRVGGTNNGYSRNFIMPPEIYPRKSPIEGHTWNVRSRPQCSLTFRNPDRDHQEVS